MAKISYRRLDQSGGAISLWVVLMVPVAAFAAVVAMAGPQRMAAESSMEEAAGDLAALTVALRDGRGEGTGEIVGFLPECPRVDPSLPPGDLLNEQKSLLSVCGLLLGNDATDGVAEGYLHRDLGYLGINTNSWQGFYSDSIIPDQEPPAGSPDAPPPPKPCWVSAEQVTRDAVYVALAGDWEDAGWAAAQAWPDGVRMGNDLVARLNQRGSVPADDPATLDVDESKVPDCNDADLRPPPTSAPFRVVFSD